MSDSEAGGKGRVGYIERVPYSWDCNRCEKSGGPQKFFKDHLKEEHGWVEGEGFLNDSPETGDIKGTGSDLREEGEQ